MLQVVTILKMSDFQLGPDAGRRIGDGVRGGAAFSERRSAARSPVEDGGANSRSHVGTPHARVIIIAVVVRVFRPSVGRSGRNARKGGGGRIELSELGEKSVSGRQIGRQ